MASEVLKIRVLGLVCEGNVGTGYVEGEGYQIAAPSGVPGFRFCRAAMCCPKVV